MLVPQSNVSTTMGLSGRTDNHLFIFWLCIISLVKSNFWCSFLSFAILLILVKGEKQPPGGIKTGEIGFLMKDVFDQQWILPWCGVVLTCNEIKWKFTFNYRKLYKNATFCTTVGLIFLGFSRFKKVKPHQNY